MKPHLRTQKLAFGSRTVSFLFLWLLVLVAPRAKADGLLDLCEVVGARDNQLIGYGVVVGLQGTGDDASAPFAAQSMRSLLRRLGVQVEARQVRLKNVAAVVVTVNIPAFERPGSKLDVTVSSIGNAKSLRGGVLVQTPMRGADRRVYAVAQGSLIVGGISASGGSGSSVSKGVETVARIPTGAIVEQEIKSVFSTKGKLTLALRSPNFMTVQRIVDAVNESLGKGSAKALDGGAVEVTLPKEFSKTPVAALAKLGTVDVEPAQPARIVINERTGTIVAGGDVRLSAVAIAQGGITISVKQHSTVSQPNPLGKGETVVVPESDVKVREEAPALNYLKGAATLADVAAALSTFGVSPRELASILQALRAAGALRAEVVVQ
ncbi:MAG: flagellar basal body P-ring protein FlgI [Polyangiaceae bacterium]|nr:flagellar basal body P-ring protein FlgI [Polyangiaceae bacterium]